MERRFVKGGEVLFSRDDVGNWVKITWAKRCQERAYLSNQCQGVLGHAGRHWCYGEDGSYRWSRNKQEEPDSTIACGTVPPGHKLYVAPEAKIMQNYLNNYEKVEVTDQAEVDRLEKNEMRKGEAITRPAVGDW